MSIFCCVYVSVVCLEQGGLFRSSISILETEVRFAYISPSPVPTNSFCYLWDLPSTVVVCGLSFVFRLFL
ncbi:hypothetical protein HanRHA438_Chr12g0572681 [Helianthus annuus]|nr:hypothetical protein HanIR_Chr12g0606171 [Helianthus annuus]KAJ0868263.1 hypothetical protein HanRHA438_Chr12g0572681 [Helianthus annuus]